MVFSSTFAVGFLPGRTLAFGISGAGAASASSESRGEETLAGTEAEARWLTLRVGSAEPGGVASM